MTSIFDKSTKLRFRNPDEPSYIKFGGVRDKDPSVGIRSGQLKLLGLVIIRTDQCVSYRVPGRMLLLFLSLPFRASLMQLNSSRNLHIRAYRSVHARIAPKPLITDRDHRPFSSLEVLLPVIGFSRNCRPTCHWQGSTSIVQTIMCTSRLDSLRRHHHSDILLRNKAVADGAISFYLDHRVSVRVAKSTYGLECFTRYKPENPQHRSRLNTVFTQPDGYQCIPKMFDVILGKVRANWHLQPRF
jgi:hypothetical protein